MESTIKSVLYTLDKIEIHGRKNIDQMLGCMQALEGLLQKIAEQKAAPVDANSESTK